jgi:hypothetical protein
VQATGRRASLTDHSWLKGPVGSTDGIGSEYYGRLAADRDLVEHRGPEPRGLTPSFASLTGPRFDSSAVDPSVARFYESTSSYSVDAWSEWCGAFRPFGWLLAVLFSRRLQQLNMPLSALDTSRGVASRVVHLHDRKTGALRHVGWVRELVGSRNVVYVGDYSSCEVPGFSGPCVRVVFPLPNGSATVVLWPEVRPDGSLVLHSSGKSFGDPGFYFVVGAGDDSVWARYVGSMKESIHVYPASPGELRTDHEFRIWGMPYLRLHYRLTMKSSAGLPADH